MKRVAVVVLLVLMVMVLPSVVQAGTTPVTVLVNNKKISFPDQQPYIDKNSRTMVPVRFVSEALSAGVDWDGTSQIVSINQGSNSIVLKIGQNKATVNGQVKTFDTRAVLNNSRTMVPLRFVSECLGAQVQWVARTNTVKITVNNGYTIPEKPSAGVYVPPANDNPNDVDISLTIRLYKDDIESQFNDVYNILASKFSSVRAKELVDYARQKKDRDDELPGKWWTINGQQIRVMSTGGNALINITVWK